MNARRLALILPAAATLSLLTGLGLTAGTARALPAHRRHLEQKQETLAALRDFRRSLAGETSARHAFEALPTAPAAGLRQMASASLPGTQPQFRPSDRTDLAGGWTRTRVEVTLRDTDLPGVLRFVAQAETERPPWRLIEFDMTSSERGGRAGRVTLLLEAVERSNP